MLSYVSVGTNNLQADAAFFDAVLGRMGYKRVMEPPRGVIWGEQMGKPCFGLLTPFDGQPATVGNGTMVALNAKSREEVDAVWKHVIELGGVDEGAPGERFPGFYTAYFRTPSGHKMNVVKLG